MNKAEYARLNSLVNGSFYPYWEDDYDTEAEVIDRYIRASWRDDVERTIEQIDRYLSEHPADLLAAFNAEFAPMYIIGQTDAEAMAWLLGARDQLRAHIDLAPRRPPRSWFSRMLNGRY
ncbi:contact-dependent growth inhibition system immunity protein [Bordetella genomosp. 13]|uniref:contact-dependent growth inhibition system immunity protein n=1 Tax=Bordetella genomosp. 13 TaxID=463040 RepID=UPI0011A1E93A|nr:contact-dependent growth inhibition system immunity protein [Bordetella genomosp. 13]